MDINQLIEIVKKKICENLNIDQIEIQDKTYLHTKHLSHEKNKFHIKLVLVSNELKKINKIEASKKVHRILEYEIKNYIHSIQILFE